MKNIKLNLVLADKPITFSNGVSCEIIREGFHPGFHDHHDACVCCGKPMKDSLRFHVHVTNRGGFIPADVEIPENDDQGFFPVGANCAKKFPKNFVISRNPYEGN